jgi:SAM-dependent methyltransferase
VLLRGAMDWDLYWRWEIFRRGCDPLDFRKWKRDSARALATLHPGAYLLDSTAGLGDHTVNLAEEGFVVEACDTSRVAREATTRAIADASLDVRVIDADWRELGRDRYDVIFNDAIHWTYDEADLRAFCRGFFDALRPGGAFVFFFADAAKPHEGAGLEILAWDWEHMDHERTAWRHRANELEVALSIRCDRGADFIDEHHAYTITEGGVVRTETLVMRRVYRWDWHAISRVLREVGFVDPRSDHFPNVKGYTFAMSRAFKPR